MTTPEIAVTGLSLLSLGFLGYSIMVIRDFKLLVETLNIELLNEREKSQGLEKQLQSKDASTD